MAVVVLPLLLPGGPAIVGHITESRRTLIGALIIIEWHARARNAPRRGQFSVCKVPDAGLNAYVYSSFQGANKELKRGNLAVLRPFYPLRTQFHWDAHAGLLLPHTVLTRLAIIG